LFVYEHSADCRTLCRSWWWTNTPDDHHNHRRRLQSSVLRVRILMHTQTIVSTQTDTQWLYKQLWSHSISHFIFFITACTGLRVASYTTSPLPRHLIFSQTVNGQGTHHTVADLDRGADGAEILNKVFPWWEFYPRSLECQTSMLTTRLHKRTLPKPRPIRSWLCGGPCRLFTLFRLIVLLTVNLTSFRKFNLSNCFHNFCMKPILTVCDLTLLFFLFALMPCMQFNNSLYFLFSNCCDSNLD